MATAARIVGPAYLLLALLAWRNGGGLTEWLAVIAAAAAAALRACDALEHQVERARDGNSVVA